MGNMASVKRHGNKWRIEFIDRNNNLSQETTPWSLPSQKKLAQNHANYREAEERFWYEHYQNDLWNFWTKRGRDLDFLFSLLKHESDLKLKDFTVLLELAGIEYVSPERATRTLEKEMRRKPRKRRLNRKYSYSGESLTISEWARKVELPVKTLRMRIERGMELERAIKTPIMNRREIGKIYGPRRWKK